LTLQRDGRRRRANHDFFNTIHPLRRVGGAPAPQPPLPAQIGGAGCQQRQPAAKQRRSTESGPSGWFYPLTSGCCWPNLRP